MKHETETIALLNEVHDYLLEKADTITENGKPYFNEEMVMADKVWNLMHKILEEQPAKDTAYHKLINLGLMALLVILCFVSALAAWDIVVN